MSGRGERVSESGRGRRREGGRVGGRLRAVDIGRREGERRRGRERKRKREAEREGCEKESCRGKLSECGPKTENCKKMMIPGIGRGGGL